MIRLLDTSVWIDFLRGVDGRVTDEVRRLLSDELNTVHMCEPVAMELLAGATRDPQLVGIQRLVDGLPDLGLDPVLDFRSAAAIFRTARRSGRTVRSLNDCLIAAVAIRHDATVLHKDADFEAIALVSPLSATSLR